LLDYRVSKGKVPFFDLKDKILRGFVDNLLKLEIWRQYIADD